MGNTAVEDPHQSRLLVLENCSLFPMLFYSLSDEGRNVVALLYCLFGINFRLFIACLIDLLLRSVHLLSPIKVGVIPFEMKDDEEDNCHLSAYLRPARSNQKSVKPSNLSSCVYMSPQKSLYDLWVNNILRFLKACHKLNAKKAEDNYLYLHNEISL